LPAPSCSGLRLSVVAALLFALCSMVVTSPRTVSQDVPSIVGTSCINCLRALPYIRAWADKYKDDGLVVIGVHSPEFDFEGQMANVQKAVNKFGITYPVALDSNHAIWDAFHNEFWPAHYFIDAKGKVRFEHFGEGNYGQSEQWIREQLQEANSKPMPAGTTAVEGQGIQAPSNLSQVHSPETYIGYGRAAHFASHGGFMKDAEYNYAAPKNPKPNEWGFEGKWIDRTSEAVLKAPGGKIVFRFYARDLHLVLGPGADNKPIRFHVTIDGHAPGENHGVDIDAEGNGVVTDHQLYQLIRQKDPITDYIFAIEFQDPGVQAYSFTFG
jgi:thiol-disulfide isomerase/thioredoxin